MEKGRNLHGYYSAFFGKHSKTLDKFHQRWNFQGDDPPGRWEEGCTNDSKHRDVIQQGSGSITLNTKNGVSATDLNSLIEKLISSLPAITDTAAEEIESVKDDLESLQEQIYSSAPKKSRMQKALAGIKKFSSEVLSKASVSIATSAITGADWTTLIQQAEMFIDGLM